MTDPFRGGGFGSVGMGPFQTGGGDFSRYSIANDGDNVALTKKYSAQIAWANGTITDDAYLGALGAYVRSTDKGSRERTGAQNEYDDAVYTIGRNKIVRSVNQAANTTMRVAALRRLIGYDRKKLGSMVGDNEQARELRDRIAESEASVREVRYSDMVRRFNANAISLSAMLSYARNAAAGSRGGPDHETWLSRVTEWSDRTANEKLTQLYQDYEHERIPGSTIIDFLQGRLGEMSPDSPQYADTQRTIEDLTKRITADDAAKRDADMADRVARGTVSTNEYLDYLHKRVKDYPKGSSERRSAETQWLNAAFDAGEQNLLQKLDGGEVETQEVVDFYRTYMTSMDAGSARYLQIQQRVTDLLVTGTSGMTLFNQGVGGYAGGGHWVSLTGAPGGTPVNGAGFASQFDGSAFGSSNCGMASAAMMAWAVSGGKVKVSGGDLRYYSGDRDQSGDERGTTYDDITLAYQNVGLGLKQYHGMGFNDWKRRLLAGEGSLISGHYMDAPVNLRIGSGADFTHTMYVDHAKKVDGKVWFFVMDPLGRGDYTGRYWPEEAMQQYGWSGRGNAGGGQWLGDVAFATKKGRSGSYISPDREPPRFQAFDTDADGRSTVGRGGGTSRQEAGRRQDWSKGKAAVAPTSWPQFQLPADKKDGRPGGAEPEELKITDEMANEFLAAVDSVSKPSISDPSTWGAKQQPGFESAREQDRRAKAKELLGAWGGDARLAAVAWFTPGPVTPDTAAWDKTQRFYANAIGTRLGYEAVPRNGAAPGAGARGTLTPMQPPSPLDQVTTPQPRFDQKDDLSPDQSNIARMLLEKLGIEATPNMLRAVAAWVATELGSATLKGNNPLGLRTTGTADLPGQLAKGDDGLAVFGSLEEGVAAAAAELARSNPEVVAAAHTGDPERFLVSLDRSGWADGGYNGALVRTYNELPGPHPKIIGGMPGLLKGAGTLSDVARSIPAVAELFDIDPRDPVQMDWLQANIDSAKVALDAGASTWTFITNGGQQVQIDMSPEMVGEMTGTKAQYLDIMAKGNPTDFKLQSKAADALREHMTGVVRVAVDEWEQTYDALDRVRQAALGSNDYATYLNATFQMADATKVFLGLDPAGPLDIGQASVKDLLPDSARTKVANAINGLDVRDASGDLNTYNPTGDPVLEMFSKGYLVAQQDKDGNVVSVQPDVNKAYIAWGKGGKLEVRTIETHPDDFEPAEVPVAIGQVPVQVPGYVQSKVMISVGGWNGYAEQRTGKIGAVVLTAFGAKTAMVPDAGGQSPAGAAPGSITGVTASGYNPLAGTFKSPPTGTANISPWLMSGTPRGRVVTTATGEDMMVASAGVLVDVAMVRVMDPTTHQMQTWYSVPGSNVWLGGEDDFGAKQPPRLVLEGGMTLGADRKLMLNGKAYDPNTDGDLSRYVHWYGTHPDDNAKGSMGAEGSRWKIRQGRPTPGGGVGIDTGRVADPTQAYLEGDASYEELVYGQKPATPAAPSRFQKDDLVAASGALTGKDVSVAQQASGTTGVVNFDRIAAGLQQAGFFDREQVPMTAGSNVAKATNVTSMPQPTGFGIKLASGVRAAADAANLAAKRVAAEAAQRAAAQKLAAIKAEQQRRAAAAAQVQATVAPRVTPTPTATIKPKATPAPSGMGQTPVKQTPTPTPTTTPKPDGRTKVLDGGV